MDITIYLIQISTLLAANWLVARKLSWLLTEWKRPLFPLKPFNCRPCLSFWLTCGFGAFVTFYIADEWQYRSGAVITYLLAACVFLSALINYLTLNNKIKIYE